MLYDQQGEVTGVGRRRFSHLIFDALPSDYVHSKFPDDKLVEDVKVRPSAVIGTYCWAGPRYSLCPVHVNGSY